MTTEEKLDRLADIVNTLPGAVTAHDSVIEAHDRQIGALIEIATKHSKEIEEDRARMRDLERQWEAYLNTLRRN